MTTRRPITVTLTVPEAKALWDAAIRGGDEWEYENDDYPQHDKRKMAAAGRARAKLYAQLERGGLT